MKNTHKVVARNGVPFYAKLINAGDTYGRNDCLTHDSAPMIEFYDARYDQFVSRYYVSTLIPVIASGHGLTLDGGVSDWVLDHKSMAALVAAVFE